MTRAPFSKSQKAVIFSIVLATFGCRGAGDGSAGQGGDGDGQGGQGTWLAGDWSGDYKNAQAAAGASLNETTVKASFKETGDHAGDFTFELPLLDKVYVKGTYNDFQGKSLLLNVKESTLSTIGTPGAPTDMNYELVGNSLELSNDRVSLRLLRTGSSDDSSSDQKDNTDDATADEPLLGRWACADKAGDSWQLYVKSITAFSIDIYPPGGSSSSLWLDGGVAIPVGQSDTDGVLTVTSSANSKYVGMELHAKLQNNAMMTLQRYGTDRNGQKALVETMNCNRR